MVSQGRIGALIEAKPAERRLLLEEAAGTSGLHARRRETELKLDAAEENLARLDDVITTIETQFESLKKQARQAQRYRRLAEHIRRTEALLFRARWRVAEAEAERSAEEHRAAERIVADATEHALAGARAREAAEAALPPLRMAEAAASAELQRLTNSRSALEQELQRVLAARGEAERRLAQLAADVEREESHLAEARGSLTRLSEERDALAQAEAGNGPARELAASRLREAGACLAEAEAVLQRQTEAAAAADARRLSLQRRLTDLQQRQAQLEARRAEAERQRAGLAASLVAPEGVTAATAAVAKGEKRVEQCRAELETAETEILNRRAAEQTALDTARQADARLARLTAEADGLRRLLAPPSDTGGPPILSALRVTPGFEAAIGAAFGDELLAPLAGCAEAGAARFWADLGGDWHAVALPEGAHSLAETVHTPAALARSLAFVGWVESAEAGRTLQANLMPGQRLVDREGRLWRWDGFVSIGSGPSLAAEHLRHGNRLAVLESEIAVLRVEALAAERAAAAARAECQNAHQAGKSARQTLSDAEAALTRARADEAEISRRETTTQARLAAAVELLERIGVDVAETTAQEEEAKGELAGLPEAKASRAMLDRARVAAADARRREADARGALERLSDDAARRRERLASIDLERSAWLKRSADAAAQQATLSERRGALEAEIVGLAARPAAIAAESETLGTALSGAAEACRRTADALAGGERQLREAADAARRADQALGEARERLARLEGLRDSATEGLARLAREIRERAGVQPDALGELAEVTEDELHVDPSETAARLERLTRERDGMGPVNLIAEAEAAEVETRIADLRRERAELTEAIARLRHGIAALDHEVRQRLSAAFERLDRHFAELFTRLFGGGKAQLRLLESDDPLTAGLEIMASPPGKRLQSLSLLSGGEQALTALALLFAAFLTNPAPVCILDEVDAPLDDANVDRFCTLVGEIADTTGTRFLVVTHHRITMARVDRLLGVTMAERGVSQLVSVDLARAAGLRQTA
jgi:chromosome segregation protein